MSRYAIAIGKPKYSKVTQRSAQVFCFSVFLMTQALVMSTDLLLLGMVVGSVYLGPLGIVLGILTLSQWIKSGAFVAWKKENIKKMYKAMCDEPV